MNLEERVAALEERLTPLEDRLHLEAGLRASGDRDLASMASDLRAMNHLLQALAITQSEHATVLREHTGYLRRLEGAVEQVRTDHAAKLDQIIGLLNVVIDKDTDQ